MRIFLEIYLSALTVGDQLDLSKHPKKSITSSVPMKLVGFYFLHLDTCEGGFQHLLVTTDHFSQCNQVYPACNKEAKIAATATTLYCNLECQEKPSMIKIVNLRTGYSNSFLNHAISNDFAPHHTILNAVGKCSRWTNQSSHCWKSQKVLKFLMPAITRKTQVQGMYHIFFCLDKTYIYQ